MGLKTIGELPNGGVPVASTMVEAEAVGTPNTSVHHTMGQIATYVAAALGRQGYRFTVDLDSTADSDPGAGLLKFDNATPASATTIFLDDVTLDGVDLSAYFAALGSTGFLRIVSAIDPAEWVVFRWTAIVDGTGYFKFTVTGGGNLGTFEDGDEVLVVFDSDASGTVANDSITNTQLANMAQATLKGRSAGSGTGDPEDLTAAQVVAIVQGDGLTVDLAGFRGIPQNSKSADYTLVAADAGKHLLHPSSDANARSFTIPANASVAFPVGTTVTFVNETSNVLSIAITSDTLTLANSTTTGTRSLAQNGIATAVKVASTKWIISGAGLT